MNFNLWLWQRHLSLLGQGKMVPPCDSLFSAALCFPYIAISVGHRMWRHLMIHAAGVTEVWFMCLASKVVLFTSTSSCSVGFFLFLFSVSCHSSSYVCRTPQYSVRSFYFILMHLDKHFHICVYRISTKRLYWSNYTAHPIWLKETSPLVSSSVIWVCFCCWKLSHVTGIKYSILEFWFICIHLTVVLLFVRHTVKMNIKTKTKTQ